MGHFRPIQPVLPAGPCPLNSESDRIFASSRNAAMKIATVRAAEGPLWFDGWISTTFCEAWFWRFRRYNLAVTLFSTMENLSALATQLRARRRSMW